MKIVVPGIKVHLKSAILNRPAPLTPDDALQQSPGREPVPNPKQAPPLAFDMARFGPAETDPTSQAKAPAKKPGDPSDNA